MYAPNDDEPFTGGVFDFYENGEKKLDGNYRKGLMNGKWTDWYENGQKSSEGTFKDGKQDGLHTEWHENGQKAYEGTFKDGENISKKCWDEDGNEIECW